MRKIILAVLAASVVSCMKKEAAPADSPAAAQPAAAMPAPLTPADVAGVWDAVGMPMDKDTVVVRFTMTNDSTGQKSNIVFASGDKVTGNTSTFAGDSLVSTAGPFKSQVRKGLTVTSRLVLRMKDGKLVGLNQSRYSNGDSAMYRITATKKS